MYTVTYSGVWCVYHAGHMHTASLPIIMKLYLSTHGQHPVNWYLLLQPTIATKSLHHPQDHRNTYGDIYTAIINTSR